MHIFDVEFADKFKRTQVAQNVRLHKKSTTKHTGEDISASEEIIYSRKRKAPETGRGPEIAYYGKGETMLKCQLRFK